MGSSNPGAAQEDRRGRGGEAGYLPGLLRRVRNQQTAGRKKEKKKRVATQQGESAAHLATDQPASPNPMYRMYRRAASHDAGEPVLTSPVLSCPSEPAKSPRCSSVSAVALRCAALQVGGLGADLMADLGRLRCSGCIAFLPHKHATY